MARLLAPAVFGVVEMAYTFILLARLLQGFSIGEILVQRDELDPELIDSLYWLNLAFSSLATVVLLALSPIAAFVYQDPLVGWIACVLSACFVLEGLGQIHASLLHREFRFKTLAVIEIVEVVAMGATVITMAVLGMGAWSIVGGTILSLIVRNVLLNLSHPFLPGRRISFGRVRSCVGFATHLTGIKFLGYLKQNFDKIVIGTTLGASPLGIYALAGKLLAVPHQLVTEIVNHALSTKFARIQSDRDELTELYRRSVAATSLVILPFYGLCAILAEEAIGLLFGEAWSGSSRIVQCLVVGYVFGTLGTIRHRLMIATGATSTLLRSNAIRIAITSIVVLVSVWFGLESLAIAVSGVTVIGWLIERDICFAGWPKLTLKSEFQAIAPSVAATLLAMIVARLLHVYANEQGAAAPISIAAVSIAFVGAYVCCIRGLNPFGIHDVANIGPAKYRWILIPKSGG